MNKMGILTQSRKAAETQSENLKIKGGLARPGGRNLPFFQLPFFQLPFFLCVLCASALILFFLEGLCV